MQTFADVASLANLAASFVLLFLRCPHFGEAYFDVGGKLQRRTVEGPSFLFGQTSLELKRSVLDQYL